MGWNALGTQFCLELGFGVLVALAFVPRAPVGALFYRIMGTTAYLPILVATIAPVAWGSATWSDPGVLAGGCAALAYPVVSSSPKGRRWSLALGWSLAWCAAALRLAVSHSAASIGVRAILLGSLSAMATGVVAGSVGLAMVLGHWYLTVPTLRVEHLQRLNRVTVVAMVSCLTIVTITCLLNADALDDGGARLLGPWGLFHLGTRVTAGLVLPLVFAWMTASSLRYGNTRSATGILYASTVLVLIGTAVSISLQDSYGVPL